MKNTSQVLKLLLAQPGPLSGEAAGRVLGCSRAAVGKAVKSLREQGYVITARPKAGYVLQKEPDRLLPSRVEARLEPNSLGIPLIHFNELDSTNLEGRRRAEAGAPHGTCLVADFQSAGRGRLDRSWLAPPNASLLFSIILRPRLTLGMVFGLTNLMALAVCKAIERLCGLEPGIKWPNDVYLGGKKLVGILTEFTAREDSLEFAVVGAGINVNLSRAELDQLPAPAASLLAATGRSWDRSLLLAAVLQELDSLYESFLEPEEAVLAQEYNKRSITVGQRITVRDGQQVFSGRAQSVADDGALMLLQDSGKLTIIRHGDVSVLKPDTAA